ncbi:MAG TPA: biotin--[acetyl-CoA-carboxylase] ligase [Gemmatimonadaceae bacterium]|nr:biotin--[acetyl-CoA-carboxylase] ligase [Gemmatimonadaceae bacterium]
MAERAAQATVDASYDGWDERALATELDVPRVVVLDATTSTLDVAHALAAEGASAGTLVVADRQTAGRGRTGKHWSSPPGSGIWLTLVERPRDAGALDVLSLRVGLRAAAVLDRFAGGAVTLKWPNDIWVGGRKLAGVLCEARWRESRAEWVAIGVGVNVVPPPDVSSAVGLESGTRRVDVLAELVPALRAAAFATGPLTNAELAEYAARDAARGRRCVSPAVGVVQGISAAGELRILGDDGREVAMRGGSLLFDTESGS